MEEKKDWQELAAWGLHEEDRRKQRAAEHLWCVQRHGALAASAPPAPLQTGGLKHPPG